MTTPDSIRTAANRYGFMLQICCLQSPISYTLARPVHAHMIASGFQPRGHILNRLIDIYSKSSKLNYARYLFDEIPQPDIVARTTLIAAYSAAGDLKLSRKIFSDTPLRMRDSVFYNAMITAYSHNHDGHAAIELFCDMQRDNFRPDNYTFTSVLGALALVAEKEKHCQQLHCAVVKSGTGFVTSVLNALISSYVKCAASPSAQSSSLMAEARSYAHRGLYLEAFEMFRKMIMSKIQLDEFTFTSVISVCANAGCFRLGKEMHAYFLKTVANPAPDVAMPVNNALITFYWKCAQTGFAEEALKFFNRMKLQGFDPCDYAFAGAIISCSVLGSLKHGRQLHAQVVSILECHDRSSWATWTSHAEAKEVMESMPFEPGAPIWEALLAGCRIHGNIDLGIEAAERLFELKPQHDGTYVLLSNMYAVAGQWNDMAKKELNSVKEQVIGFSCLNYQIQIGFQGLEVPLYRVLLLQLSKCMRSLFTCFLLDFNERQASKSNEVIRASFYLYSEFLPLQHCISVKASYLLDDGDLTAREYQAFTRLSDSSGEQSNCAHIIHPVHAASLCHIYSINNFTCCKNLLLFSLVCFLVFPFWGLAISSSPKMVLAV
ncbi:hypothetical protein D5086_004241 [Populus alba]|uniref:Uncharacterized protein n=1 Tax=Populus alba TaxID=43335 RepID=A0ACC4CQ74_POPAL